MWIVTTFFLALGVACLLLWVRSLSRRYAQLEADALKAIDMREASSRQDRKIIKDQAAEIAKFADVEVALIGNIDQARAERDQYERSAIEAKSQAAQLLEECSRWREKAENADRTITHLTRERDRYKEENDSIKATRLKMSETTSQREVELAGKLGALIHTVKTAIRETQVTLADIGASNIPVPIANGAAA